MKKEMTKYEIRDKCERFGLAYLGKWDNKHWALLQKERGFSHLGGVTYELTNKFITK
jgi:hypothetical protein